MAAVPRTANLVDDDSPGSQSRVHELSPEFEASADRKVTCDFHASKKAPCGLLFAGAIRKLPAYVAQEQKLWALFDGGFRPWPTPVVTSDLGVDILDAIFEAAQLDLAPSLPCKLNRYSWL